ncbi:hypothetical protein FSP39_022463 [Pinctada imbricata]|uniref:Uncharacterized protein n=1 Tax=Pinctada imbricata TaxID=66713 RepID=A0AA88XQ95_PINIB|nr:hypothetical protein FSP39_022463 [Pinctada imbricata]
MADDPMLSLFDTDGSFLDDLTGTDSGLGGPGNGMDGSYMGPQPGMQQDTMMNPLQHPQNMPTQGQQGFGGNQYGGMGNMPYQNQQQQFSGDSFNQFSGGQKLHHMNLPMANMPHGGGNPVIGMGQPQPFGSNVSHQPGYGSYNMGQQQMGPRLPNPHQPSMGMGQSGGWPPNHGQEPPFMQQNAVRQPMMSPQQQPIPNTGMMGMRMPQQNIPNVGVIGGGMQQTQYLSHHDFALSTSGAGSGQQGPMNSFPPSTSSNQPGMMYQGMASPNNRISSVPISSSNNPMAPPPQRAFQQQMGHAMRPPSFTVAQPQIQMQQQGFPSNFMNQQPQQQVNMNSNIQTSSYQRFPFPHGQGNVNMAGMGDVHSQNAQFSSKTSPNQSQQFRPSYAGVPQQRATTPSPRPTPPPSVTPDSHPSPTSQGSIRHPVPNQQSDQMISPPQRSNSATPVSSPFHPSPQSDNSHLSNNTFTSPVQPSQSTNQVQNNMSAAGNLPDESVKPSVGPTMGMIGQDGQNISQTANSANQGQNVEMEIQTLQQQLNQLQGIPQTQQSQEKMLGLQERIRSLRAQQELQRQQQQQHPQQLPPQQPPQQSQFLLHHQQPQPPQGGMHIPPQQPGQQMIQIGQPVPSSMAQQPNMNSRPQLIQIRQPGQYPGQPQKLLLVTQGGQGGQPIQRLIQPVASTQQMVPQGVQHAPMAVGSPQKMQVILQQQPQLSTVQQPGISSSHLPTSSNIPQPNNAQQQVIQPMPGLNSTPVNIPSSVVQLQLGPSGNLHVQSSSNQMPGQMIPMMPPLQEANNDAQEAVARAQAQGLEVPKLMIGSPIPATVDDVKTPDILDEEVKKKKKRVRKPREPKTPKEKKEKKPDKENSTEEKEESMDGTEKLETKKPKTKTPKPSAKKKKKPVATFLKNKKKRKRRDSSEGSDMELKGEVDFAEADESQKRRSARNTKRKKYHDEIDIDLTDDETQDADMDNDTVVKPVQVLEDNPIEEDRIIVDKILGSRMRKPEKDTDVDVENDDQQSQEEDEEVEEFFVKYKNYSYLHCEWKTADDLEKNDKRIHQKIRRFKMKKFQTNSIFSELDEDELFNPDYVEVDRVLDVSMTTDPTNNEEVTYFLVKWRGLSYEDSTWELQQDVDPGKVKAYYNFRDPPPEEDRTPKARGIPDEWVKLDESREYKNGNQLRDYQLEGVNWLTFCWHNEQNCILADEMGLGKTIQSITFLNEVLVYGVKGPFLVIVPLSTLGNWQREFETWTDINTIVYHGTAGSRNMLQAYEMFYKDENGKRIPNLYKFQALVTTYECIISDCELLSDIEWRCLIIDEAHRLKNAKCRLMEGLKMFECEHRVLLSGTPLQNNTEELHSLLSFLEPERFKSTQAFLTEFGDLKTDEQVDKLKAILKPMMLRRLKEDVEKNLAAKEETIVEVELTNIQKKYYRAILERNFTFLSKGSGTSANVPNLLNTMMELRKCCNHPYLIKGAEDKIIAESKETKEGKGEDYNQTMDSLVNSCGKMVLLDKLLPKLKQNGHKVLIFSQMVRVLDILEDYLLHRQYLFERIDGRICGKLRQEAIDRFSKPESDRFVFLLCTKAGGLGINLTAADTVIIYDSDWNPQNDLQAQARCHRIGQTKEVKVYRLITRNSYEREMFDKASLKLGLDKAVLQSMGGEKAQNPQAQMSKKEIEELLRKGAYGALMDDDKAGDEFCEEDIDQILQRRTQVIQIESEGKGSTFAKASFSTSDTRTDIDINDPNFWQKWAKKADFSVDDAGKNELIIEEPRQRKQTARYGNDDALMEMSELESSSNSDDEDDEEGGRGKGKGKKGRKPKKRKGSDDDYASDDGEGFSRSDCFKVEKNLLVYGWGRWKDILCHGRFKKRMADKDVENISRALLIYSLQQYKGDEKIKEFIWDLISPSSDGSLKNHSGLSAPVPRGRKGKGKKKDGKVDTQPSEPDYSRMKNCDPEVVLRDPGYRRHLHRHANKVLLRVRLLYYLKEEIIGDAAEKVFQDAPVGEIDIPQPMAEGDLPKSWWDEECDRSLLIGVFKHGYEKYNMMRQDPALCFLSRCGPPDGAALAAEQNDDDGDDLDESKIKEDDEDTMGSLPENKKPESKTDGKVSPAPVDGEGDDKLPWLTASDLNTRLRRIITGYQRNHKRMLMKNAQKARKMEKRERFEIALREREQRLNYQQWSVPDPYGLATQHRWSRREETDFYRVISSFGVEFDLVTGRYKWDRFRQLARLEKKFDDTLTEYFQAFYHMCMRVCKKFKNDDDALPPNNIYVEPITEERASRCLARIDLLNKIRAETLNHPKLEERIKLCQPSYDLPSWWVCGKHDKELLIGAARHGVVRTDYYFLLDSQLSFQDVLRNKTAQVASPSQCSSPLPSKVKEENGGLNIKKETDTVDKKDIEMKDIKEEKDVCKEEKDVCKEEKDACKEEMDVCKEEKEVCKEEKAEESSSKTVCDDDEDTVTSPKIEEMKEEMEESSPAVKEEKDVVKKEEDTCEESEEKSPLKNEKSNVKKSPLKSGVDAIEEIIKSEIARSEEEERSAHKIKENGEDEVLDLKLVKKEKDGELRISKEDTPKKSYDDEELEKYMTKQDDFEGESMISDSFPHSSSINWPKDRVVFHRLEHICYCVEHGEWPFPKRMSYIPMNYDSRSATPIGSSTPRDDPDHSHSDAGDSVYDGIKGDGLKMTFHKRRGQGRNFEGLSRVSQLMNQSGASSDNDSTSDTLTPRSQVAGLSPPCFSPHHYLFPPQQTPADLLNGAGPDLDPELLRRSMLEHSLYFGDRRGRRGRKRKAEKMAEIAMAEALARRQQARSTSGIDGAIDAESRIPVVNLEDGSRLSGDEAPMRKDIEKFLDEHPGYMIDKPSESSLLEDNEYTEISRKGRKPKVDPALLDPGKITGEENVSVVNRLTGKKITGAKAPPMRYLAEWLEQNPFYDVDPKWADLVKAKGNLPKNLLSRVIQPNLERRRGRPRESSLSQSVLGDSPFSSASMAGLSGFPGMGLMSSFNKLPLGMPFGALPNFSMSNPMMGLAGFMPGFTPPSLGKEAESKKEKHSPSSKKESSSSRHESKSPSSSQTPHPSFPFLYNPLMLMSNPLLAAQAQGLNFSLPSTLPSSFAALAQSNMMNGKGDSDLEDREPGEVGGRFGRGDPKDQDVAQDLSVRVEAHSHHSKSRHLDTSQERRSKDRLSISSLDDQDQPTDLSMKSKSKESPARDSHRDGNEPKDFTKTKNKIQGSFKLNKIVDTLKDKVNKMEDKVVSGREKKDRKSKLDSILMKIAKEKDVSVSALNDMDVVDTSAKTANSEKSGKSSVSDDSENGQTESGDVDKDSS